MHDKNKPTSYTVSSVSQCHDTLTFVKNFTHFTANKESGDLQLEENLQMIQKRLSSIHYLINFLAKPTDGPQLILHKYLILKKGTFMKIKVKKTKCNGRVLLEFRTHNAIRYIL